MRSLSAASFFGLLVACSSTETSKSEPERAPEAEEERPKRTKKVAEPAPSSSASAVGWPAQEGDAQRRWELALKATKAAKANEPITPEDLISAYSENPVAADVRFSNRPIIVAGVLTALEVAPISREPQAVMKHRKNEMEFKQLRATMDELARPVVATWKAGDVVGIACKTVKPFDGLLDIELQDCVPRPTVARVSPAASAR